MIYLMNADAEFVPQHDLLNRPDVVPFYTLSFFLEGADFEASCRKAVYHEAVRFFWTNEDVLGKDTIGFTKPTAVSARDKPRYETFSQICHDCGRWPKVIQYGSEHSGQSLAPSIKQYDTLRWRIIKDALTTHGFYPNVRDIAVDWLNFSGEQSVYADDYNCHPLTFLTPRAKWRSNAQFYSINFQTDDAGSRLIIPWPGWIGRLQSYLSQSSPGAMPFLDAVSGPEKIKTALAICSKYKANPIFFLSESYGGSVGWQMGQIAEALK